MARNFALSASRSSAGSCGALRSFGRFRRNSRGPAHRGCAPEPIPRSPRDAAAGAFPGRPESRAFLSATGKSERCSGPTRSAGAVTERDGPRAPATSRPPRTPRGASSVSRRCGSRSRISVSAFATAATTPSSTPTGRRERAPLPCGEGLGNGDETRLAAASRRARDERGATPTADGRRDVDPPRRHEERRSRRRSCEPRRDPRARRRHPPATRSARGRELVAGAHPDVG